MLRKLRVWYPNAKITLLGDGGFAAGELVATSQQLQINLISRLRTDAQWYAFVGPQPKGKRGPKPQKGVRLPSLASVLADPKTLWCQTLLWWYGETERVLGYRTGVCLWYTPKQKPVPIRWVLARSVHKDERAGKERVVSAVFFSSEPSVSAEEILGGYVGRWNIEVTFAEMRAHLGFETQRHWSRRAIGRTTPALFGLFSLIVLIARRLYPSELPLQQSVWYRKEDATFSDVLGAVRCHLWGARNYTTSGSEAEVSNSPPNLEPTSAGGLLCRLKRPKSRYIASFVPIIVFFALFEKFFQKDVLR